MAGILNMKRGFEEFGVGAGGSGDSATRSLMRANPDWMPKATMPASEFVMNLHAQEVVDHNADMGKPEFRDNKDIFWQGWMDVISKKPLLLKNLALKYAHNQNAWPFRFFPIIRSEASKIKMAIIKTGRDLPPLHTLKTTPRNVSFQVEHATAYTGMYAQGFEMDLYVMREPEGREEFDLKFEMVINNMYAQMQYLIIKHLQQRSTFFSKPIQRYPEDGPPSSVHAALEDECRTFGALAKRPQEFGLMVAHVKAVMAQEDKSPWGVVVTPEAMAYLQLHNLDRQRYLEVGGSGTAVRDHGEDATSLRGIQFFPIPMLDTTQQSRTTAGLLTAVIARGSKFELRDTAEDVPAEDYRHAMRRTWFCGWDTNDYRARDIIDVARNSPAFHPMPTSEQMDEGGAGPSMAGRLNRHFLMDFIRRQETVLAMAGNAVTPHNRAGYDVSTISHRARKGAQPHNYVQTAFGEWSQTQCAFSKTKLVAASLHARLMVNVDNNALERGAALIRTLANPPPNLVNDVVAWLTNLARAVDPVNGGAGRVKVAPDAVLRDIDSTSLLQAVTNDLGSIDFAEIPDSLNGVPYGFANVPGLATIAAVAARIPGLVDGDVAARATAFTEAHATWVANLTECMYEHPALATVLLPMHNDSAGMTDEVKRAIVAENFLHGSYKMPLLVGGERQSVETVADGGNNAGGGSSSGTRRAVPGVSAYSAEIANASAVVVRRLVDNYGSATGTAMKKAKEAAVADLAKIAEVTDSAGLYEIGTALALLKATGRATLKGLLEGKELDSRQTVADVENSTRQTRTNLQEDVAGKEVSGTIVTPFHLNPALLAPGGVIRGDAAIPEFLAEPIATSPTGYKFNLGADQTYSGETAFDRADRTTFAGTFISALPLAHPAFPLVGRMSNEARAQLGRKTAYSATLANNGGYEFRTDDQTATFGEGDNFRGYLNRMAANQYPMQDAMPAMLNRYKDLTGQRVPDAIPANYINPYSGPIGASREYGMEENWVQSHKLGFAMGAAVRALLLACPTIQQLEAFARNNVRIYYNGLILRPSETQHMRAMCFLAAPPVGFTAFNGGEDFIQMAGGEKHIRVGHEYRTGPFMPDNRNMYMQKHTHGGRVLGGKGTKFINEDGVDRTRHVTRGEVLGDYSCIAVLQCPTLPEEPFSQSHLSLRGYYDHNNFATRVIKNNSTADFSTDRPNRMYDGVNLTNFWLNIQYRAPDYSRPDRQNYDQEVFSEITNFNCSQSTQLVYDSMSANKVTEIASHHAWGPQRPGLLAIESGKGFVQTTQPVSLVAA